MKLSIGELSKRTNLSIPTLRYYEDLGLLKPDRDRNNRRIYSENDISWLDFIMRLKKTNMPMKDIILYSELRYQGDETVPERMELLENQMKKLEDDKSEIEKSISMLSRKIEIYKLKLSNKLLHPSLFHH